MSVTSPPRKRSTAEDEVDRVSSLLLVGKRVDDNDKYGVAVVDVGLLGIIVCRPSFCASSDANFGEKTPACVACTFRTHAPTTILKRRKPAISEGGGYVVVFGLQIGQ